MDTCDQIAKFRCSDLQTRFKTLQNLRINSIISLLRRIFFLNFYKYLERDLKWLVNQHYISVVFSEIVNDIISFWCDLMNCVTIYQKFVELFKLIEHKLVHSGKTKKVHDGIVKKLHTLSALSVDYFIFLLINSTIACFLRSKFLQTSKQ